MIRIQSVDSQVQIENEIYELVIPVELHYIVGIALP